MYTAEFISILVALFIITDPLGNVGIFLSLTDGDSLEQRRAQAFKGNLYALILLLVFLFGGPYILSFIGITLHAVDLGGGLIVGAVGWGLVRAKEGRKHQGDQAHSEGQANPDISFCPLALPLIAGPGAVAVVIDAGKHAMENGMTYWIGAVVGTVAAMIISWICMRQATWLLKILGQNGMNALTRIVGFLLVCIAAQMIITGASGAFGWHQTPSPAHTSTHGG